jgi:isoleucyl-tRNA synthetase
LSDVLEFELVPNFKVLGARLRDRMKDVQPALNVLEGAAAAAALEAGQSITVLLGGQPVELGPDDIVLRVRGQQGFAVSREGGEVVALDLTLDEPLRHRGLAREVVRLLQDLRKTSGLEVSDRIRLHIVGLDAIAGYFDFIAREVLAVDITAGPGEGEATQLELEPETGVTEARVWLRKAEEAD